MCEASSNLSRFDGVKYGAQPLQKADLNTYYQEVRSHFGPEVKRRIILGTFALSSGYYQAYYQKACQIRRLIQNDFLTAFETVDAILSPVAPTTAYQLGEKTTDPLQMYLNDIFTVPVNLAGLPAISLPIGKDQNNLPIGLQLIGQPFKENALLALAKDIELLHS